MTASSTALHSPRRVTSGNVAARARSIPCTLIAGVLTPVVVLVHGYLPFAGDAGIYVAGVWHVLDPSLYPLNAAFVVAFTKFSAFPWTMAAIVRISHLPFAWALFTAYVLSIFLFLTACGQLAARLFCPRIYPVVFPVACGRMFHASRCRNRALHHGSLCHRAVVLDTAGPYGRCRLCRPSLAAHDSSADARRFDPSSDGGLHA